MELGDLVSMSVCTVEPIGVIVEELFLFLNELVYFKLGLPGVLVVSYWYLDGRGMSLACSCLLPS